MNTGKTVSTSTEMTDQTRARLASSLKIFDIFRQNVEWRSAVCVDLRPTASFVVQHKMSGSNIWRTVCPRITKFYTASMPTYLKASRIRRNPLHQSAFWKFEKAVQNAASDGFGSNFSGAWRFACPTNWWASCFCL